MHLFLVLQEAIPPRTSGLFFHCDLSRSVVSFYFFVVFFWGNTYWIFFSPGPLAEGALCIFPKPDLEGEKLKPNSTTHPIWLRRTTNPSRCNSLRGFSPCRVIQGCTQKKNRGPKTPIFETTKKQRFFQSFRPETPPHLFVFILTI